MLRFLDRCCVHDNTAVTVLQCYKASLPTVMLAKLVGYQTMNLLCWFDKTTNITLACSPVQLPVFFISFFLPLSPLSQLYLEAREKALTEDLPGRSTLDQIHYTWRGMSNLPTPLLFTQHQIHLINLLIEASLYFLERK